jgi:hypothetical protein
MDNSHKIWYNISAFISKIENKDRFMIGEGYGNF